MNDRDDRDRLRSAGDREVYEDAQAREQLLAELRRLRGSRSLHQIADEARSSPAAVSELEKGWVDPGLSLVQRFARAVGARLQFDLSTGDFDEGLAGEQNTMSVGDDVTLAAVLMDLMKEGSVRPQTSAELAARTGLPPPSIARTIDGLLATRWLDLHDEVPPRFSLRTERGRVIGVSVSADRAQAVLTTLRPTDCLDQRELPLHDGAPGDVVRVVNELVEELRPETDDAVLVGLGVTLAGLVQGATGDVLFAPDLQTTTEPWHDVELGRLIQEATRLPTAVENDANALAIHEYLLRQDANDLAIVLISESGEGIGGGLVINNEVTHGVRGVSAEIGHTVVDPAGQPCRCGQARGCLETVASPVAIVRQVRGARPPEAGDLASVAELVRAGDEETAHVFSAAGTAVGRVLANLTALLGPSRIVFLGPPQLADERQHPAAAVFLRELRMQQALAPFQVGTEIEPKVLTSETAARAAASAALHYFVAQPRSWVPGIVPEAQPDVPVVYSRPRNRLGSAVTSFVRGIRTTQRRRTP